MDPAPHKGTNTTRVRSSLNWGAFISITALLQWEVVVLAASLGASGSWSRELGQRDPVLGVQDPPCGLSTGAADKSSPLGSCCHWA